MTIAHRIRRGFDERSGTPKFEKEFDKRVEGHPHEIRALRTELNGERSWPSVISCPSVIDEGGYGRFGAYSRVELERFFYLDDEDRRLIEARRRDYNRLGFALQVVTVPASRHVPS